VRNSEGAPVINKNGARPVIKPGFEQKMDKMIMLMLKRVT